MLADGVVYVGDGGGVVPAAMRPVQGATNVARLMASLAAHALTGSERPVRFALEWVNGAPGLLTWEGDTLTTVMVFTCAAAGIEAIHVVRNPAKLRFIVAQAGS